MLQAVDEYLILGLYVDDIFMVVWTPDSMKWVPQRFLDFYAVKYGPQETSWGWKLTDYNLFFYFSQTRTVDWFITASSLNITRSWRLPTLYMARIRVIPAWMGETTECGRSNGTRKFCTVRMSWDVGDASCLVNLNASNPRPEPEILSRFCTTWRVIGPKITKVTTYLATVML